MTKRGLLDVLRRLLSSDHYWFNKAWVEITAQNQLMLKFRDGVPKEESWLTPAPMGSDLMQKVRTTAANAGYQLHEVGTDCYSIDPMKEW